MEDKGWGLYLPPLAPKSPKYRNVCLKNLSGVLTEKGFTPFGSSHMSFFEAIFFEAIALKNVRDFFQH